MFFNLHDSKDGIIKSISVDLSKLDKHVCDHLKESIKTKLKFSDDKLIIRTNITLDELKTLNDGYNEFHSQFIIDNVLKNKIENKI